MKRYIIERIIAMFITLFIIMTIAFMVIRLMPGSVYDNPELPPEVILALEEKAHLNEPLVVQYWYFLTDIFLDNNWGVSVKIEPSVPVFTIIQSRIPISLAINLISLIIAIPIGIMAGTIAALNKSKWPDNLISFLVVICISVPSFVFASMMQYFIGYKLGWFPIVYEATAVGWDKAISLVLPIAALSFGPIATVTRYLRGELIETVNSEYMILARTKGMSKFAATFRHAFRNSCVPLANIIIPMFTNILGGSLVVERIFGIPGIGGIMVDAVNTNDHSLTIAILLFYSFISLLTILIVDISYGLIDPRIRLGGK